MEELTGLTIKELYVGGEEQDWLVFVTDDGKEVLYETFADCCSETWFADITGVDYLLGATVTSVEEIKTEEVEDERTRQEYDTVYGYKLTTNKGYVDIVYRNSSNGYYGGECAHVESRKYDLYMVAITDDWEA